MVFDMHILSSTENVTTPILQNLTYPLLHWVSVQSVIYKATNSGFLPDKVCFNKRHLAVNVLILSP